ncbi:hypothetical protein D3C80_1531210 [compost metagenome]
MITLEQAIYRACGVVVKAIPSDGKLREFKVNSHDKNIAGRWYCISMGDCAAFGRIGDHSAIAWCADNGDGLGGRIERLHLPQPRKTLSPAMLSAERTLVAAGHAAMDSGRPMDQCELDRYIQAMEAVIWHDERALAAQVTAMDSDGAILQDGAL